MFSRIGENTLHIFGVVNFLSLPMVWALYPETANRTLEEMVRFHAVNILPSSGPDPRHNRTFYSHATVHGFGQPKPTTRR